MLTLEPRDTPTTFLPLFDAAFPADLIPPVQTAFDTASASLDVPGVSDYPVAVQYDPRTLVLGYGTYWPGESRGAIWLGAAVRAYDVESVALHEVGHAAGAMGHTGDRTDLMYVGLAPDEIKRAYTDGDAALFRGAGLVVIEPAGGGVEGDARSRQGMKPHTPADLPYTESHPYRGPLVRVALWGGWADVPPRVAADWGLT